MKTLIILDFFNGKCDALNVSHLAIDHDWEAYIEEQGYKLTDCQWMILENKSINFINP